MSVRTVNAEEMRELMEREFPAGRSIVLTVTGHSMSPTLSHLRDQVYLTSPQRRKPRRGEIVFFQRKDGTCILHRIIKEEGNQFVINGDSQTWTEVISRDQVLGVAEGIVRNGRYISCNSPVYRAYVFLWRMMKPVRGLIVKTVAFVKKCRNQKRAGKG
ncbi:S24/S26 family peptidase [Ruminococcus sp. CLA-AA-H200]|uniref:S24/S26 family peptidase n=1 Tax=Ruminococcus turbiniformis TaxID=2881258 RepID=A0ABS8FZC7_9FIRM|nr:S24/S26 family peptidase [Ruminococcus turbiniformis]MCC2255316.1 S24/S26 family peptidase [Ruminococcus turbiniformis]